LARITSVFPYLFINHDVVVRKPCINFVEMRQTFFLKYRPCGGQATTYNITRFCSSSNFYIVDQAAANNLAESSKDAAKNGIESKPKTAFSFWCPDIRRSPIGA
ncbi:MAG: hypothetical protein ACI8VW_003778, partial [bacterium]